MTVDPSMVPIAGDRNKYPESFLAPTGFTRTYAERFTLGLEALANRTEFLRYGTLGGERYVDLPSGRETSLESLTSRFTYTSGEERFGWLQTNISDPGTIYWQVHLQTRAKITGLFASVLCEPFTLGTLPATMPRILTYKQPIAGPPAERELLYEQIDPSGDAPTFNAFHTIGGVFATPITVSATDVIVLQYKGMAGGGALSDALKLMAIRLEISPVEAP